MHFSFHFLFSYVFRYFWEKAEARDRALTRHWHEWDEPVEEPDPAGPDRLT